MSENINERAGKALAGRWRAGMHTPEVLQAPPWTLPLWDEAVVITAHAGEPVRVCTILGKVRDLHPGAVPDMSDPATRGAFLDVVREAWCITLDEKGVRWMTLQSGPGGSTLVIERVEGGGERRVFTGGSDAVVFVAALEAAS